MPIYYSPETKGFYDTDAIEYTNLPNDCIELSESEYKFFLSGIYNNQELVLVGGQLSLIAKVRTVTWDEILSKRQALLQSSDYTQTIDWPGDKVSWAAYRQLLRDIPQTYTNPEDVIWPTPPGA